MMPRLKRLILYILTRDLGPNAIAFGFCYGMALGLIPRGTPQWVFFFLFVFFLRVNLIVTFGTSVLVWAISIPLTPWFHSAGLYLLVDIPMLQPLWRTIYHAPLLPYLQLNNSIVLAATLCTLLAIFPCFTLARWIVFRFHAPIREFILRSYLWRALHTQHFEKAITPKS